MREIVSTIINFKDELKIIPYDYEKYDSEISKIAFLLKKHEIFELIKIYDEFSQNKYFELKHPLYNDITLRAVFDFIGVNDDFHYVFMIDETQKHSILLMQFSDCINSILSIQEKIVLEVFSPWKDLPKVCLDVLKQTIMNDETLDFNWEFKDIEFEYLLQTYRPYHWFLFENIYFENMNLANKKVSFVNPYFISEKMKNLESKNSQNVKIRIRILEGLIAAKVPNFKNTLENYTNLILNEALLNLDILTQDEFKEGKSL